MQLLRPITYEELCAIFDIENAEKDERCLKSLGHNDDWPRARFKEAQEQFGVWSEYELSQDELLTTVRLHWNSGDFKISKGERPTIAEGLQHRPVQDWLQRQSEYHDTNNHIVLANGLFTNNLDEYRNTGNSAKFLAVLDGLHRIVTWANLRRPSVLAFVAGQPPTNLV